MSSFPIAPRVRLYLGKPRARQGLAFEEWRRREQNGPYIKGFPESVRWEITSRWGIECRGVFIGVTIHKGLWDAA